MSCVIAKTLLESCKTCSMQATFPIKRGVKLRGEYTTALFRAGSTVKWTHGPDPDIGQTTHATLHTRFLTDNTMSMSLHSENSLASQARNHIVLAISATLWLSLCGTAAHDPMNDWVTALAELHEIQLGDSDDDIAKKTEPLWFPVVTCESLRRHPFDTLVPYTNVAVVTEWRSRKDTWDGRPVVLFAVFSDARKTNLVDALLHDGYGMSPLVAGLSDKNLRSVKAGDSMTRVFRLLGRRDCQYFQDAGGKWRIKVTYPVSSGGAREFEADAGTGKVLKVTIWNKL